MKRWTIEEENLVKKHYEKSKKDLLLSLLPNRSWTGIKIRGKQFNLKRDYTYSKDESFFESPNLNNCWVSGFIAGDGFLIDCNGYKSLGIELSNKDMDILEKIKELTKYTGVITSRTRNYKIKNYRKTGLLEYAGTSKMASLKFCSADKYHDDLFKNWNLIPNKVKRLEPPNLTDLKLILSFISGNICADGNIDYHYNQVKNAKSLVITFLGTEQFLEWIKTETNKIFKDPLESYVRKERQGANVFCYRISSIKSYIISKMILSLDIYHMERKWGKARDFIKMVESCNVSTRFLSRLRRALTPEIIDFVKGTPQEFPPDFLNKIGYFSKT